jgi:tetratricopeptide (TPR) repeat protein
MPTTHPVIGLLVLLVNLLAAGATSFPGVFLTAWVLVVVALANARAPVWAWKPSRALSLGLFATSALLAWLCMRTEFSPVLTAPNRIAMAEQYLQGGRFDLAREHLQAAAKEDPWSPAPQRLLAHAAHQQWLASRLPDDWQRFVDASDAFQGLAPRHHATFTERGNWLLEAWRAAGDPRFLNDAIEDYRKAVLWYPGRALVRAQLAWALHLAGRTDEARAAADEAQRLDNRMPHSELKLSGQTIYDPQPGASGPLAAPLNAEQVIRQLRTRSSPN